MTTAHSESRTMTGVLQGLGEQEVLARRARGLGNNVKFQTGRSYAQIVRQNVFTFINTVLFGIGFVLVLMGQLGDAFVTAGLVLMNVVVGVFQEARAKRKLDQIALLTRPKATVIREGQQKTVDPAEIVVGDLLVVNPGDQIVVDGTVVEGRMDADESLLTGESDHIPKAAGDPVYSGSFSVTGSAIYEAQKVGAESVANKITAGARKFSLSKTPLQLDIDYVIRVLVLLAVCIGSLLGISFIINAVPAVESVKVAAVIVALVPQGLFFMTTVTYALGALRMAGTGALVQQSNAVESMSHVNVLCMDKTGTLTTNNIRLHELYPQGISLEELRRLLGFYAASASSSNRTNDAIRAACPGKPRPAADEVPFSSARKWSALAFDDGDLHSVYALGAPEILAKYTRNGLELAAEIAQWSGQGLRVVLFAHAPQATAPQAALLHDAAGEPCLPEALMPLGLITFSDELRPEAGATLAGFRQAGIRLKIISGDNPQTVAALARQAEFDGDLRVVSGLELDMLDDAAFADTAAEATVFGRITPEQKERLVDVLRARGEYVAMIGDGVNDVLSLKKAQIGVAMNSGSQATRGVADIVLLNDSFAVLPAAFQEGQRILNGMQDIVRLFLARTLAVTLLVIATAIIGLPFPVTPKHNSVLALLTVGIPVLGLAAWAKTGQPREGLLRAVAHFVLPAAFTIALVSLGVYIYYFQTADPAAALDLARTALTTTTVLCGLVLLPFVEPPTRLWAGGDDYSGDRRPMWMALAMLALYAVIVAVPAVRDFFELVPLAAGDYLLIGVVVLLWAVALRFIWRRHLFERLLQVNWR